MTSFDLNRCLPDFAGCTRRPILSEHLQTGLVKTDSHPSDSLGAIEYAVVHLKGGEVQQTRLLPISEWVKYHAWPPQGGLRHLVFNAKTNGFDQVIRRIGRRVLIDEAAFFAWAEKQGAQRG